MTSFGSFDETMQRIDVAVSMTSIDVATFDIVKDWVIPGRVCLLQVKGSNPMYCAVFSFKTAL